MRTSTPPARRRHPVVVVGLAIVVVTAASACGSTSHTSSGTSTAAKAVPTTQPRPAAAASPALLARGKSLFTADSCSSCHSFTGVVRAGPPLNGLLGSTVYLTTGKQIVADSDYITAKITNPDGTHINGYEPVMGSAIKQYDLAAKPGDVRALVAYISAQK